MTEPEWQSHARALAAELTTAADAWREVFANTPRHLFVPTYWALDEFNAPSHQVSGANPEQHGEWLNAVYSNRFLATDTQTEEDGRRTITSSASLPALVARMLHVLNLADGQRVLEIGTGSGYNTALLSYRTPHVASVDIDPELVNSARKRLVAAGYRPHLVAGDGRDGIADHAPYDRILSTCASAGVPDAWIDQLADGGRIVAPFTFGGALAVLDKTVSGTVSGHFDIEQAYFMPAHDIGETMPAGYLVPMPDELARGRTHRGSTAVPLEAWAGSDFRLWLALHVPAARVVDLVDDSMTRTGVIVHTETHRAQVDYTDHAPTVTQDERRLWDTVETAWTSWEAHKQPGRDRLGLTAISGGPQYAWLDDPDSPLRWPVPRV